MSAEFDGKVYPHEMIAHRQREVAVSSKALRMMQEHHGNKYLSFKCVPSAEEVDWYRKAEALVPKVTLASPEGKGCECGACSPDLQHASSCAVHNGPALPVGPCDCRKDTQSYARSK